MIFARFRRRRPAPEPPLPLVACVRDEMSDLMAKAARKPAWLYGSGCCQDWTPEGGCPYHTGRSAMSLRARELG